MILFLPSFWPDLILQNN